MKTAREHLEAAEKWLSVAVDILALCSDLDPTERDRAQLSAQTATGLASAHAQLAQALIAMEPAARGDHACPECVARVWNEAENNSCLCDAIFLRAGGKIKPGTVIPRQRGCPVHGDGSAVKCVLHPWVDFASPCAECMEPTVETMNVDEAIEQHESALRRLKSCRIDGEVLHRAFIGLEKA